MSVSTIATTPQQRAILKSRAIDPTLARVVPSGKGEYRVLGQTDWYTVRVSATGYSCDCPAGAHERPACWHRASCWRLRLSRRALKPLVSSASTVKALTPGQQAKKDLWG